jgi:TPR repeat protein
LRCARCGNENEESNRFCGMCGATLLQATPARTESGASQPAAMPVPAIRAVAPAPPSPPAPRSSAPEPEEAPVISGPSFLGLNAAGPSTQRRGSLSIDPSAASSSRDLDYLLEDDDEPKGGGAGKYLLIVVALLLAAGFGYLRWKGQPLPFLGSGAGKPAATADGTDTSSSAPAPASSSGTTTPPSTTAENPTTSPAASSKPASAPAGDTSTKTQPDSTPAASTPAAATPASTPASGAANVPASKPVPSTDGSENSGNANSDAEKTDSDSSSGSDATNAAAKAKPTAAAVAPAPKPRVAPAPRVDAVNEARKYLYGQNVPQNCDHGLRILKPLAEQSNAKAMIEMGALYSAGLCTPRDLPTAYRWFALALRKDPDNQPLQGDLQKLWGEMTQPERQLAIKLSQ